MTDQPRALALAARAFEMWEAGRLAEAEALYRESLETADEGHYRTPDIHGELGSVISHQGREPDARPHYEEALRLELRQDPDEGNSSVVVARHRLAEHYIRTGEPQLAISTIEPAVKSRPDKALPKVVQADALRLLGRFEDARRLAREAVGLAASEVQRRRIQDRLVELLR